MKSPKNDKPRSSTPASRMRPAEFRHAIEKAERDGVNVADMTLRLTHRDEAELKRDPAVAVADISFADGEMRYLGVKVVAGGVAVSALDLGEAA